MLGPLLFDNRGAIVKKKITKKKFLTVKKNLQKSLFRKKNFLLNMNLKNVVKQKRCTRVILLAEKISTRKNQN